MSVHAKDPSSDLDYSFDWSAWLASGEAITNSSWSVSPEDTHLSLARPIEGGSTRGIHIAGGLEGARYRVSCRIETDAQRVGERSFALRIMER